MSKTEEDLPPDVVAAAKELLRCRTIESECLAKFEQLQAASGVANVDWQAAMRNTEAAEQAVLDAIQLPSVKPMGPLEAFYDAFLRGFPKAEQAAAGAMYLVSAADVAAGPDYVREALHLAYLHAARIAGETLLRPPAAYGRHLEFLEGAEDSRGWRLEASLGQARTNWYILRPTAP